MDRLPLENAKPRKTKRKKKKGIKTGVKAHALHTVNPSSNTAGSNSQAQCQRSNHVTPPKTRRKGRFPSPRDPAMRQVSLRRDESEGRLLSLRAVSRMVHTGDQTWGALPSHPSLSSTLQRSNPGKQTRRAPSVLTTSSSVQHFSISLGTGFLTRRCRALPAS